MTRLDLQRIWRTCMMLAVIALGCTACDSAIYDDEGDCTVHYRVGFRYTKNILGADAFGAQVDRIHLYVFDKQGRLVVEKTDERALSTENDYFMEVDILPGKYDLLAWCEGTSNIPGAVSFSIGGGNAPAAMSDLGAELPLQGSEPDLYSDRDIHRLYHGMATDVDFPDTYGVVDIAPIYLTRDTKHISVLLQNLDGSPVEEDEYTFAIEDANQALDYRNRLLPAPSFSYRPWSLEMTSATFDQNDPENKTRVQTEANGLLAELSTGRLMAGRAPRLVIRNRDGEDVIRINLIQYLLLVKSKYQGVNSDQDYLDCCDDYTLMFFLQSGAWARIKVYINSWRVVPPQDIEF